MVTDVTGNGMESVSCLESSLAKNGQDLTMNLGTIHQLDAQTNSLPHCSDQDEAQFLDFSSRALETTIHQIDDLTLSLPRRTKTRRSFSLIVDVRLELLCHSVSLFMAKHQL